MTKIYDNQKERFTAGLTQMLQEPGVEWCDFCVGYFNLRGWELVAELVEALPGSEVAEREGDSLVPRQRTCRLLVGMLRPPEELLRAYYNTEHALGKSEAPHLVDAAERNEQKRLMAEHFRQQITFGTPSTRDQATLRSLARQLRDGKVTVKLYLREPLHAKLYIAHQPKSKSHPCTALMGSSNLTFAGFTGNGELNADFTEREQATVLNDWFDAHWNDTQATVDISAQLLEALQQSWATEHGPEPYLIYMRMVWHLSEEARLGLTECAVPAMFADKLLEFQQTAVQIAARRLMKGPWGGAMIGDVVGLGKTITACAIAKIFEQTYAGSTLVVCPANLVAMWREYVTLYDLKAEVRSLAGKLDGLGGRLFRLIIVDESHNLRSGSDSKRYLALKALIEQLRQHSDTAARVLLLSATPYNKDYQDLANQLRLFIDEDTDLGLRPDVMLAAYQSPKGNGQGEAAFVIDHPDINLRTLAAFEESKMPEDWNALMRPFLIRRTRSFIQENYAERDDQGRPYLLINGEKYHFPQRVPISIQCPATADDQLSQLYSEEVTEALAGLLLPRYGLHNYVGSQWKGRDNKWAAQLSQAERDTLADISTAGARLIGFTKATFFKRLDSSGYAFLLTLARHILRNMVVLHALEQNQPVPVRDENQLDFDDDNEDEETDSEDKLVSYHDAAWHFSTAEAAYLQAAERHYTSLANDPRVRWLRCELFQAELANDLRADNQVLLYIMSRCGAWRPANDAKLNALHKLLTGDLAKEKALIFTQYADSAQYLHLELERRGVDKCQWVRGGNAAEINNIVRRFSPRSNNVERPDEAEELRLLIATDALSEGQNLQDAHIVMNYDLPWAIIRLIQRAGRVDRIGQQAASIACYSFFPADGVEELIHLRERLEARLATNSDTLGCDERFWEGSATNLQTSFEGKAGLLDEPEPGEVDLTSQALKIWQTATAADECLEGRVKRLPVGAYSTMLQATGKPEQGTGNMVVTLTHTGEGVDVLSAVDSEGHLLSTDPARLLNAVQCGPKTPTAPPLEGHLELVAQAVTLSEESARRQWAGATGGNNSPRNRVLEAVKRVVNAKYQERRTRKKEHSPSLFNTDDVARLKEAHTALYKSQMTDAALQRLKPLLALKTDDRDLRIAQAVLLLHNDKLLTPPASQTHEPARALVSLGIVRG